MIGVVILEKDLMVRTILEGYIAQVEGYQVVGMGDSLTEAQKIYDEGGAQLILGEVTLQDGDVLEWLARLRYENKPVDFIAVTGDPRYCTFYNLTRYGLIDYILKPFVFARVREALLRYRNCKQLLSPEAPLLQENLDAFFFADLDMGTIGNVQNGIRNFSRHTYERIYNYARENYDKSFTAGEVAEAMEVSRITARRYLEMLEKSGHLAVELHYGKVGRPQNRYRYKGMR